VENLSIKQLLEENKRLSEENKRLSEENKRLSEENKLLALENEKLRADNARLNHEMSLMRQKMDLLIRRMFGRSSEKLDANQLELFILNLDDESGKDEASSLQEADPIKSAGNRRGGTRRERWPSDLPVVEEVIESAEVVAALQDWRLIGAEVSEQLDYQPAKFLRRRLVRRKYVHRLDREIAPVIAPLPEVLLERCIAAPRSFGCNHCRKILRSSSPLPSGKYFWESPRGLPAAGEHVTMDGLGRRLAAAHL
jgi:hypothetical protein